MEVKVAAHSGFCFGVKQALARAQTAAEEARSPVYTWGPIIHNQRVVRDLEAQGITAIDSLAEVDPGVLVIRAHGAPPWVFEQARELGFSVVDATCPNVRKVQETVQQLTGAGKTVVVVGRRGHPEVVGICGWASDGALVVESPAEARALRFRSPVGVVAQTTQRESTFTQVVMALEEQARVLEVYPTICQATQARQDSALSLAQEADTMVVIGSRHSANTVRLVQVCRLSGIPVYHIESVDELRREWLRDKRVIGIVAGASTPDVTIEEVKRVMMEFQRPEGQNFEDMYASAMRSLQAGEIIPGKVVRIDNEEVLVDVGYKSEGVIPLGELSDRHLTSPEEEVQVGDEIKVYVLKVENSEGNPLLSKKRADYEDAWEELEQAYNNGDAVSGEIIQVVKGGLIIHLGLRAFLPASQVGLRYEPNLEKYVGQDLRVKVIEMDRNRNKVIASQKAVLEQELEAKKEALWEELAQDQVRRGTVTKITYFGAFVDLGGIEGLVHISELSWARVKHPSEVLQESDEIDVMVLGVDRGRERVSLGLKQVLPDPWEGVSERYPGGTVHEGTVTHIVGFGAFVQLEPGVEGLVHISQLANRRVGEPGEVVQVGDPVKVYILDVNEEERRISLSMKEVEERFPEEAEAREAEPYGGASEETGPPLETGYDFPGAEPAAGSLLEEEEEEDVVPEALGGGMRIGEVLGELLENRGHLGNAQEEAPGDEEVADTVTGQEEDQEEEIEEPAEETPAAWGEAYGADSQAEETVSEELEPDEQVEEEGEEENEPGLHY